MSILELLKYWSMNLKLAFVEKDDKIVDGSSEAYAEMKRVDEEIRRRERAVVVERERVNAVGYYRKPYYTEERRKRLVRQRIRYNRSERGKHVGKEYEKGSRLESREFAVNAEQF
jgi:hypothetical protein